MISVWSTLLAISQAQAGIAPCGEVKLIKSRCSEDGTGFAQFEFDIPALPDDLPIRSLDLSVLRADSSSDSAFETSSFYSRHSDHYGRDELETPAELMKGTVRGDCGQTIDFVDVLYNAEKVEEVIMDVKGRMSESLTWLEGEPVAAKRGAHLYIDLRTGDQYLTVKWAGGSENSVHMTVFKDAPSGESGEAVPMEGGSWTHGGFHGAHTQGYRASEESKPLNDPLVQIQMLKLKPIQGVCRLENLTITKEVEEK